MEKKTKLSEARIKANKKWDEKNKERKNYIRNRSTAKNFILTMNDEDISLIEGYLEERKNRTTK